MATKTMNEFCDMIDSYGGRDKVMKVLCYSAKLVAGYHVSRNPDLAKRYAIISSKISSARATLRLIDDIPMIQYALEYGLGANEGDAILACLGVTRNIVDLLYYPLEKICWLSDNKVINIQNAEVWDALNSVFWSLSVFLNLVRTSRNYLINNKKLNKAYNVDEKAWQIQQLELISILRLSLDFVHATSTLQRGFLWGGKLSTFQVGVIGTLSGLLGIYQILEKKKIKQKS